MRATAHHALGALLTAFCAIMLLAAPASAQERPYFSWNGEPRIPMCEDASVQGAVAAKIARADVDYYGGLRITELNRIVETSYQVNRPSPYARRYCEARASLNDGSQRRIYYAIMEHSGFVGVSWNLRACLAGLDPWHVYDANCRTVRP
ncbi:cytoplasmic protein [Stappia indica]|uniref:cytoplasmic protein n=1 Tax=Stappia indica TaxID=538381 RepID=UPI001CD7E4D0|nr:cytoplasmic protein [Stappia indica]MCA1300852.1 cytoplasmic protein [Stappia indica]